MCSAYFHIAESLIDQTGRVGEGAVVGRDVGIDGKCRAKVGRIEFVGVGRVKSLGMADEYRKSCLALKRNAQLAHHILSHIQDVSPVGCSANAAGGEAKLCATARRRLWVEHSCWLRHDGSFLP